MQFHLTGRHLGTRDARLLCCTMAFVTVRYHSGSSAVGVLQQFASDFGSDWALGATCSLSMSRTIRVSAAHNLLSPSELFPSTSTFCFTRLYKKTGTDEHRLV